MTWPTKKLGEVVRIQNGFAFKSAEYTNAGFFVMRITNVQDGFIELNNPKYIKETKKDFRNFMLKEGDILISLTGNVGRVGIIQKEYLPAVLNQRVARIIVIDSSQLDWRYLFNFLKSPSFVSKVIQGSHGMAQQNVSTKDIENLEIPLPPIGEQRKIIAKLEGLLGKIKEVKLLRAEAQEAAQNLLPAELHKIFSEGKKKGWEEKSVEKVTNKIQYGYTASAKQSGTTQLLRITDIQNGSVNWDRVPWCDCKDLKKYKLYSRDIVFARTGATVGKSFLIKNPPENAIFASYLIRASVDVQKCLPEFLYYFFQSPNYWTQITEHSVGGAQPNVNGTKLKKLTLPLPSIAEQKKIVAGLDSLSEKIRQLQEYQKSTASDFIALEQSILSKAFTA